MRNVSEEFSILRGECSISSEHSSIMNCIRLNWNFTQIEIVVNERRFQVIKSGKSRAL